MTENTFTGFFTIVAGMACVIFVLAVGLIAFVLVKLLSTWSYNNRQPVVSLPARVVAKRTATSGGVASGMGGSVSTWYYATFELDSGERLEFGMHGPTYGQLAEGDRGTLTYQGTRYHGFRRLA
jgi:hypothetical protein